MKKPKLTQLNLLADEASILSDRFGTTPNGDVDKMNLYCSDAVKIMRHRNQLYKGAYRGAGVLGAAFELLSCVSKLRTLVTIDPKNYIASDGEPDLDWVSALRNVLVDTHNYSLITLLMLEEDNFDGVCTVDKHYYPSGDASEDVHS